MGARGQRVEVADSERRMIGALTDLSERYQAREQVSEVERRFRLLFDRNPAPFWVFDPDTLRFIEVNDAAVRQYGYSRDEFLSMSILDIRPREGWDEVRGAIQRAQVGDPPDATVRLHRRKDGSVFEVRAHLSRLDFDGQPACLVLAEDVSERLAYERDLAYRARHNPATGLLNVRALTEQLDEQQQGYTIAFVQLRGLQLVADTLGREIGDAVLQSMATRLGGLGARCGTLAFQPAEDFVFAIGAEHDTQRVLDDLLQIVSAPMRGKDSLHQFEPRIGVAVHTAGDGHSAEQVIGMAAQAAHAACRGQRGGLVRCGSDHAAGRPPAPGGAHPRRHRQRVPAVLPADPARQRWQPGSAGGPAALAAGRWQLHPASSSSCARTPG